MNVNLPPGTPVWIVALAVILAGAGFFSPFMAKVPGWLGAAARRWQDRQLHEVEREKSLQERIRDAVRDGVEGEVQLKLQPLQEQIAQLQRQLDDTRRELCEERKARREQHERETAKHQQESDRLTRELDLRDAYILEMSRWSYSVRSWAADNGHDLPAGRWLSFREWLAARPASPDKTD